MGRPVALLENFQRGMRRDHAREDLPAGALWNVIDLLPNLGGAKLRERGGWGHASNDIAATKATAAYVIGGMYGPFVSAAKNVAIDEDGELYTIASNGTVTDVGAAVAVAQNPVFHREKAIIPASGGATAPKYYDGNTTVAALGGSPPTAVYATVFKDRTILARTAANTNRIWFSGAGNPASWDTTNSYWDLTNPITGLASLRGAILIFHDGHFSTLVGSTPPTVAGGLGDFRANDPLFEVGCTDARSIAYWGDKALFANPGGIYITDGATYDDVTALCGMKTWWHDLVIQAGWTLAGGLYREHYVYCVMNGASFVDAGMIDLRRLTWWRQSNLDAVAFWRASATSEELYFGRRGAARVGKLSSVFSPTATVKNDGDGDAVAGVLETPYFRGRGGGKKGLKRVYVMHELVDYASDNPSVTVSYVKTPEETSYTAITGALGENTAEDRPKKNLGISSRGIAFKLARANAGDWRLNGLELEASAMEGSR